VNADEVYVALPATATVEDSSVVVQVVSPGP